MDYRIGSICVILLCCVAGEGMDLSHAAESEAAVSRELDNWIYPNGQSLGGASFPGPDPSIGGHRYATRDGFVRVLEFYATQAGISHAKVPDTSGTVIQAGPNDPLHCVLNKSAGEDGTVATLLVATPHTERQLTIFMSRASDSPSTLIHLAWRLPVEG